MRKLCVVICLACLTGCQSGTIFYGQNPDEYNPELEALARQKIISGDIKEVIYRGGDVYIDGLRLPVQPSLRY